VTVAERVNGNDAGAHDEWGNLKDTFHIHVHMVKNASGAGGQTVSPVATVSWK
jgi:hypothetical protein